MIPLKPKKKVCFSNKPSVCEFDKNDRVLDIQKTNRDEQCYKNYNTFISNKLLNIKEQIDKLYDIQNQVHSCLKNYQDFLFIQNDLDKLQNYINDIDQFINRYINTIRTVWEHSVLILKYYNQQYELSPNKNELLWKDTCFLLDEPMSIMSDGIHNITQYNNNIIALGTGIPTKAKDPAGVLLQSIKEETRSFFIEIRLNVNNLLNELQNLKSYCKDNSILLNVEKDQTESLDDLKKTQDQIDTYSSNDNIISIIFLLSIVVIVVILGVKSISNRDKIEEESSVKKEDYFDDIED